MASLEKFLLPKEKLLSAVEFKNKNADVEAVAVETIEALDQRNFERVLQLSRILLDVCWEHLNSGHWKDIDVQWRKLYSLASFCQTLALMQSTKDAKAALKSCDMGLLMGAPILDNILQALASHLHGILRQTENQNTQMNPFPPPPPTKKRKLCYPIKDELRIPRVEAPSLVTFQESYLSIQKPTILTGAVEAWPARQLWSLEHIRSVAGHRTVPVEVGSRYTEDDWSQKLMTINQFIDDYMSSDESKERGYLAQHQLFDQIPELGADFFIPDYCWLLSAEEEDVDVNAWFGPAGTVSPLHQDPRNNLLVQVFGSKYIRLYDLAQTPNLYPFEDGMLTNTSQVDVENPDLERFPNFKSADYTEEIVYEGEILFIPKKCWHFIRSLEPSFSISFWFGD